MKNLPKQIVIYGGTGQARVVRPILERNHCEVMAIVDDTPKIESPFPDVEFLNGFDQLKSWLKKNNNLQIGFVIAIGNPHGEVRLNLQKRLENIGLISMSVIHEDAIIAKNCQIGKGVQIMPGAIIMPGAKVGDQCIINTKASLDHDSILGNGCELAPGSTVCGEVKIHDNSWIGAGATILPKIVINKNVIVGAGALVNKDVEADSVVVGIPAKTLRKKR